MTSHSETQDQLLGIISNFMNEGDRSEPTTVKMVQSALNSLLGGTAAEIDRARTCEGQALAVAITDYSVVQRHHAEGLTRRNLALAVDGLLERFVSLHPITSIEKLGAMPLAVVPDQIVPMAEVA